MPTGQRRTSAAGRLGALSAKSFENGEERQNTVLARELLRAVVPVVAGVWTRCGKPPRWRTHKPSTREIAGEQSASSPRWTAPSTRRLCSGAARAGLPLGARVHQGLTTRCAAGASTITRFVPRRPHGGGDRDSLRRRTCCRSGRPPKLRHKGARSEKEVEVRLPSRLARPRRR